MARAVVYQNGKYELVTKPVPEPEAGLVVVRMKLMPVNPVDTDLIPSVYEKLGRPAVPGFEGFGVVHSVGEGVTKFKPAQRVVPFIWQSAYGGNGSWQEYVSVAEKLVWPVPDSISDEAAAQFVINPWTAYGLVEDLKVPKGEYLLQAAAGSVLGRQVIQLARHLGIKTINIVRRSEQKEELKALGADEVISSSDEDVVARVKEITNNTLAFGALDSIGGPFTKTLCKCVRNGGEVIVYGSMGGTYDATADFVDLLRGVTVKGWRLDYFSDNEKRRPVFVEEISKLMEKKIMLPLAGEKFDLADVEEAVKRAGKAARGGKVLLTS